MRAIGDASSIDGPGGAETSRSSVSRYGATRARMIHFAGCHFTAGFPIFDA